MEKKNLKIILMVGLIIILVGGFFALKFWGVEEKEFDVDEVLIKVAMKENTSLSREILISSYSELDFKIQSEVDFLLINEKEFKMNSGGRKKINLLFDINGKEPGVYLGKIIISGGKKNIEIPVVVEIETKEILFDSNLNIPIEYSIVYSGESFVVENQIFNLESIGSKNIEVKYFVKDLTGRTIIHSPPENIAVETNLPLTKVFSLPADIPSGDYIVITVIKHKNSIGTSTYLFKIANKNIDYYFSGDNFYMWVVFILLLVIILFILYNINQKDKFMLELSHQHKNELKKEFEKLEREREKLKSLPRKKRKPELKKLKEKKKKRVGVIHKIYKSRVKVLKKLKKNKKEDKMEKKLNEWKKQGYNVEEFSVISSGKSKKGLNESVKKLKEEGFKY